MYSLVVTDRYRKKAKKFFLKHPEVIVQYGKVLKLLCLDPKHPSLRLHKLSGRLDGLFSVSINISYRMVVNFIIKDDQIVPIDIGSHEEVY